MDIGERAAITERLTVSLGRSVSRDPDSMTPQYAQFVFLIIAIVLTVLNINQRYFTKKVCIPSSPSL